MQGSCTLCRMRARDVLALTGLLAALALPALALPSAVAQTGGYQQVIDVTVPVAGPVVTEDDYDEPRDSGRIHQANDLYGVKLQRVHAAAAGVVCDQTLSEATVGGYQVVVCGDDGRRYVYTHFNDDRPGTDDGQGGLRWAYAPDVREGGRVARGQWLGYVGDSGNAEDDGAQLHFGITDPSIVDPALDRPGYRQGRLNPWPSLEAARARGDVPATPTALRRLGGATRLETAVLAAGDLADAETVVVAPSSSHAAALAAAPLAAVEDAPVLLSGGEGLAPSVAAEVERLQPTTAWIVQRDGELGQQVAADLRAAGVQRIREVIAPDAGALSAQLARLITERTGSPARVLLAVGEADIENRAWPDALSASALAAHLRAPVLLTRPDALPPEVADVLAELRPGTVQVVGGTEAVRDEVARRAGEAAGAQVTRLAGATRYGTSVAVADEGVALGLDAPAVWLATGTAYPDALAAGPAAARAGAPLLLVDGPGLAGAPASDGWLLGNAARVGEATILGGAGAVTDDTAVYAGDLLGGR